jgi:cellobiose epimerase
LQLRNLINLFLDKIIDPHSSHLNLFFDENWECKSAITSYGHDIESSWLLYEAALELHDPIIIEKAKDICLKIVESAKEGLHPDGSLIYEKDNATGHTDFDRHWWPQAEAVVGFYNAFELTGNNNFLLNVTECLDFIQSNLVDSVNGEWYWSLKADGTVNHDDDKAGFWKCPYHNGRMSLEIMKRIA